MDAKTGIFTEIEDKLPRSMCVIRSTIRAAVHEIGLRLTELETEYCSPHKDVYKEIKQWIPYLKDVARAFRLRELSSSKVVDAIFVEIETPGVITSAEPEDLQKLAEIRNKVKLFVPNKFEPCLSMVDESLLFLQKYCLSFYDMAKDPYFETGQHYSLSMIKWKESVKQHLDAIRRTALLFAVDSVSPHNLCQFAQKIIAKTEAERFAFLGLFAHVVESVREISTILKYWVDFDENYIKFITHDISDLEKKKSVLVRKTREAQERHFQATHRTKTIDTYRFSNENENKRLKLKADNLIVEEEGLIGAISGTRIDLDIQSFQKEELIRSIGKADESEMRAMFDKIRDENRLLNERLPLLQKRMEFVKEKLEWIELRRDKLQEENDNLLVERKKLMYTGNTKVASEKELKAVNRLLDHVKLIHLFKTSPDVIEKIHYGVPFEIKSHHMKAVSDKKENDMLDQACVVTAREINKDWPTMYSILPFLPPRGCRNIETDIQDLTQSHPRDSHADQALRSLYRWRRYHTRARLQDLKVALNNLKRLDIIDTIDQRINPPKTITDVKETPLPAFLESHLIPYYRAIERYDQVRASQVQS